MGNPHFRHLAQRLAEVSKHLEAVASVVEDWPEHLQESLIAELDDLAQRGDRLAIQVGERSGVSWLHGFWRSKGAYFSTISLPFPGQSVFLVVPDEEGFDGATSERLSVRPEPADRMDIVAYLDTDDQRIIDRALGSLENLADSLGYSGVEVIEEIQGSIFRRATSWLKQGVQSDEVALRLAQVERAVLLGAIDTKQAEVDEMTARAVESLVTSVAEIPRAVMRAGSLLLIKYEDDRSEPVVLVRQLSAVELSALERHPGLQREPESLLANLAVVIQQEAALPTPPGGDREAQ